ncbi:MAG: hypothetical protein U0414_35990 [Polyangiaceae bacterium]
MSGSNWGDDLASIETVGVQLRKTDVSQLHVALVYRVDGTAKTLELAWHRDLVSVNVELTGLFAPLQLDPANAISLAAYCEAVALENHANIPGKAQIPYWIRYDGETFTATGQWLHDTGLTCATFVLAVLSSQGLTVARHETWGTREDDLTWQCKILRMLASKHPREVAMQRKLIGASRLRPEEVAVAATLPPASQPATFAAVVFDAVALFTRLGAQPFDFCERRSSKCMLGP